MNMLIRIIVTVALSFAQQSNAKERDFHENFARIMDQYSNAFCKITIKPNIIVDTHFDNQEKTRESNLKLLTQSMGWSSLPPFEIYTGKCSITNSIDFNNGNSAIIHTIPHNNKIADQNHYFFYIKRIKNGEHYTYVVSWNGSNEYMHAHWFITDSAKLEIKNGAYLIKDQAIDIFLEQ
jgi:hypothetical protein